ncbi:unnamed protein product [Angiostrongylus costaricensis]|uniref:Sulfatase domain-containing protein n=1 Tax=Angiostrongylus costaricensis TaxID=334426 RepID=A0A158PJX3_ANGCS|nr:unnamed protein product [Angiostrongylus costaricensis]
MIQWIFGLYNDSRLYTPNLRTLAFHRNSVQLTNSYVNQLCTPTRSAFMTGYYPFRVGTQNGVFLHMEPSGVPLLFPFLPENLRSLGYSTYLIGKWHLGYCRREFLPTSRGFDYFYGFYGPQAGYFNHSADLWHHALKRVVRGVDLFEELGSGYSTPVFDQNGVYSTDLFADAAMEVIEAHDTSKPFFLFLSFQAVHPPLQVIMWFQFIKFTAVLILKILAFSLRMLTSMDFAIGRVIDFLKATKNYEDTVVIFTSDNGGTSQFGASNYPLRGEKDTLWEGGTKTTTIVHAPKFIRLNGIRPGLFHVVDWHATLLALAGLQIESYGDGINQWDYIATGFPRLRRFRFVYNIDDQGSAIRDGEFKLIHGNADRRTLRLKLLQLQKYMRKNVRKPVTLKGNPEMHNGSYASYWCT